MRRDDRRAAREGKRNVPDLGALLGEPMPAQDEPSDGYTRNDQQALRQQIQHERHVSGATRRLY